MMVVFIKAQWLLAVIQVVVLSAIQPIEKSHLLRIYPGMVSLFAKNKTGQ